MHTSTEKARSRLRVSRHSVDGYLLSLMTAGGFSMGAAAAIGIFEAEWTTPLLDLPLGSYLLGGLGGLLTLAGSPGWARRLGSRHPPRVLGFTFYRLVCACLMGGVGYALVGGLSNSTDLLSPEWFRYLVALAFGGLERLVNEVVLQGLGFLAPRGIDPRL